MTTTRTLDVGLDLDGCFYWFDRAYYRGCRLLGLLPADTGAVIASRWEFYEDYGHDLDMFVRNCHVLADHGLLWSGPIIPGGKHLWNTLYDAGHRLHVITDRSFGAHPVASEVGTRTWLATHGLRYHSLTFSPDKTVVRTDIMLEDKLANYDALDAAGHHPVLINRLWNTDDGDTRRRIRHLDQFAGLVADRAAALAPA